MLKQQWLSFLDAGCWGSRLCKDLQEMIRTWHENDPDWVRCARLITEKDHGMTPITLLKNKFDPEKLHLEFQIELVMYNPYYIRLFDNVHKSVALAALSVNSDVFKHIKSPSLDICLAAARINDDFIAVMDPEMASTVCEKLNIFKPYVRMKRSMLF